MTNAYQGHGCHVLLYDCVFSKNPQKNRAVKIRFKAHPEEDERKKRERGTLSSVIIVDCYQLLLRVYGQSLSLNNGYTDERRTNTAVNHYCDTMTIKYTSTQESRRTELCWHAPK